MIDPDTQAAIEAAQRRIDAEAERLRADAARQARIAAQCAADLQRQRDFDKRNRGK